MPENESNSASGTTGAPATPDSTGPNEAQSRKGSRFSDGWNPQILPAFFINLVDVLGMTIIIPLLPFYAEKYGASPFAVGMLVSVFAFCQLIGSPILGKCSDVIGRKPMLMLSQAGTLVGFIILAQAPNLGWVFVSRVIDGLTAGNISLVQAHISDTTAPEDRAKSFAMLGIAFGIGFFVGPAISGYLSQYNYQYPICVAAGLSAVSIALTGILMPNKTSSADGVKASAKLLDLDLYLRYFRDKKLASTLCQWLLYSLAFAVFTSGFALFAERQFSTPNHHFGVKEVGFVLCYVGFLGMILPVTLTGRLIRVLGDHKTVQLSLASLMVGYGMLGFVHGTVGLIVSCTLTSFGGGMLRPVLTSVITKCAPKSEQGAVLGVTQSLMSLAQILGPLLSGALIDRSMLLSWSLLAAAFCVAGLAFSARCGELMHS
jgi:DHA1 family tetracycline resistance protein-like MFS transporter